MSFAWLEQMKVRFLDFLPHIIIAIFILIAGFAVARIGKKWLGRLLDRSRIGDDLLLKNFFLRMFSATIILLSALVALSEININIQAFVAGVGVTGIILGFGFKDTLSNFAAGLLLLIYRPFRAGQEIEVEGSQGTVEELTIVNMRMRTDDGVQVIMPNSKVWGAKIMNYSACERRRMELTIKVSKDKIEDAIEVIQNSLIADERILEEPAPAFDVSSISGDAATLIVKAWTLTENFSIASADLYLKAQNALGRAEIAIL